MTTAPSVQRLRFKTAITGFALKESNPTQFFALGEKRHSWGVFIAHQHSFYCS